MGTSDLQTIYRSPDDAWTWNWCQKLEQGQSYGTEPLTAGI